MERSSDRIVLVTGAAGAVRSAVTAAIRRAGGVAITAGLRDANHTLDVTREADWRALVDRVAAEHGRLDGFVNAAGVMTRGPIERMALADWRNTIDAAVLGTFLGIRTAWTLLGVSGGSVVQVSLVTPGHGAAAAAARGAVRQLTRAAALDGARQPGRIRVNAVEAVVADEPRADRATATPGPPGPATPLGRTARPEEIAACVAYLLSGESAFVTGAAYVLDGGLTAV
jgi:NAD(P)-dependent dehydrogenase (short-subunit alcohol dehydrogenase family)